MVTVTELTLGQKQRLFTRLIAELIVWIYAYCKPKPTDLTTSSKWVLEVSLADGSIDNPRRFRIGETLTVAQDGVHMPNSLHYQRLAQDLNLFIDGEFIKDGGHPAWTLIGEHWESMNPLCRWGGRFLAVDSNHFSLEHDGRA